MRIFIHNVDTFLGKALVSELLRLEASNEENIQKHRIFGTCVGKPEDAPKAVKRSLQAISAAGGAPDPKRYQKLRDTMVSCSLIIFDLFSSTLDDLHFALSCLKVDPKSDPPRTVGEPLGKDITFVLISSAMVWAGTPANADGAPLRDVDYKRRVALPNSRYEKWREMEDLVLHCFNREESTIKGLILAPGLLYGEGEESFGPLFKSAWLGLDQAYVEQKGDQRLPTVHVRDLARAVREIGVLGKNSKGEEISAAALQSGEECPYYVAVDQPPNPEPEVPSAAPSAGTAAPDGEGEAATDGAEGGEGVAKAPAKPSTRADILRGIVDEFSDASALLPATGEPTESTEVEQVRRLQEATALDLYIAPSDVLLRETFAETCSPPGWWCSAGLLANLPKVAEEFCRERKLRAIRTLVVGPPASGKTTLARSVADHYNIPHLTLAQGASDLELANIRERLSSKVCRYRGYVLDARGASFSDADKMFREDQAVVPEEGEEEAPPAELEEGEEPPPPPPPKRVVSEKLCPEFVAVTQASEDFCRARARAAAAAKGSDKTMEQFQEAMNSYKSSERSTGASLVDFFQEHASRSVLNLPVAGRDPEDLFESTRIYMDGSALGRPFNYLRSEEDVAHELLQNRAKQAADAAQQAAAKERELAADKSEELEDQRKSKIRLEIIAAHEEEQRQLQEMPLRLYLMQHMVPSLTEGLIEVCKVMPEDPIDYLATYLEKHAAGPEETRAER